MSKRFWQAAGLMLACGLVAVIVLYWWPLPHHGDITPEELRKARLALDGQAPQQPATLEPLPLAQTVRLAIGSLGAEPERNQSLADVVTANLTGTPGLDLVERRSLQKVLDELHLSLAGLVRASDAVAVGKLLRADWFLLGTTAKVGATNSLVLRLVDSRTGILRDAGVVPADGTQSVVAADIAGFVRQSRQRAAAAIPRICLAIGTFEDLSVNDRLRDLPAQLRGSLIAAYRNSPLTLLEREEVETLLEEVRLDLAGLTGATGTNAPRPMQSAFWLVNGRYQSFETANVQVEMDLDVTRVFGTTEHIALRDAPGEPMIRAVKDSIDQVMKRNTAAIVPTRQSEVRLELGNGKDLLGKSGHGVPDLVFLVPNSYISFDDQVVARHKRNVQEALRAFRTALLLEPTNREAKLYVATCLRDYTIQQPEEARSFYREVIDEPVQDKWTDIAERALVFSFDWRNAAEKAEWFTSVSGTATNSPGIEFYRREATAASAEAALKTAGPKAQQLGEAGLWNSITNALLNPTVAGPMGTEGFIKAFGNDSAAAGKRLAELYPEFKSRAPELAPYTMAAVITGQVDTNAPVIAEFQQTLTNLIQRPEQVYRPDMFWLHVPLRTYDWAWQHTNWSMAVSLLEAKIAASRIYTLAASYTNHVGSIEIEDRDRLRLAFAYLGAKDWEKALTVFETFAGQPFSIFQDGPWGVAGTVVFTDRQADYCRKKLGLPVTRREEASFAMGKPVLPLCSDAIFTTDDQGVWLGLPGRLVHLDSNLATNDVIDLPVDDSGEIPPTAAICLSSAGIWVGTDGQGLYQFDKASRRFRRFRERDGLLMDKIAALCLTPEALWIGYGRSAHYAELASKGGLGRLDLHSGQLTSFTASMLKETDKIGTARSPATSGTPRSSSVLDITAGARGDIWFLSAEQTQVLCRYRSAENAWDGAVLQACRSVLSDSDHLYVGREWNYFGNDRTNQALGVCTLDVKAKDLNWHELKRTPRLPSARVTAMALDNGRLWVGGFGYVALVDPNADEARAVAYVQTESVDRLHVGGGYIWAQFKCSLFRAPLPY
jgi:tetratricopeptide (TPR) repeat protein